MFVIEFRMTESLLHWYYVRPSNLCLKGIIQLLLMLTVIRLTYLRIIIFTFLSITSFETVWHNISQY